MNLHSYIRANVNKTYLIMVGFVLFVALIGYVFGNALDYGNALVPMAFGFSVVSGFASYFWGDKIVLSMSRARPADRKRDFDFFTTAENMAIAAGIPKPKLYVIDDTAMNAFTVGRDPEHAIICATTGLINRLERRELEGVIAHEFSHIKNYDIRLMSIVAVLVGTVAFLADMFNRSLWRRTDRRNKNNEYGSLFLVIGVILALLAPVAATIIQMSLSRNREYLADADAAKLTRNPRALASALAKLSGDREVLEAASNATAHLYIVNPFKGKKFSAWFSGLFDTHPPIEERMRRLYNF